MFLLSGIFFLIFLIKGHKLLGVSQSKSTINASTKKYITKSVSCSLNFFCSQQELRIYSYTLKVLEF